MFAVHRIVLRQNGDARCPWGHIVTFGCALSVAAFGLLAAATAANAQSVASFASTAVQACEKCEDGDLGGPHRFHGAGAFFKCENCHITWKVDRCSDWHLTDCGGVSEQQLEQIALAVDSNDAEQLGRLITQFQAVAFNVETETIDARCEPTGVLLARVTMTPTLAGALAEYQALAKVNGT